MDRPISLCWRGPISNITGSGRAPWRESAAGSQISRFGLSAGEAVISPNTMLSQCGGDAGWPGWKPQNGDCTNVAMYEDCRVRGPRHRQFPARAVRAGRLAPGPGQRDPAEVRAAPRVELRIGLQAPVRDQLGQAPVAHEGQGPCV